MNIGGKCFVLITGNHLADVYTITHPHDVQIMIHLRIGMGDALKVMMSKRPEVAGAEVGWR